MISGRYVQLEVYPFSYQEHLAIHETSNHSDELFEKYIITGGMPTLYHITDEPLMVQQTLEAIFNTIILKDIIERYHIRNVALLEKIIRYFFDNIGNLSSAKRISDFCKSQRISVGVETVQNYVSYLESCYLFHRVKRNDLKGKKILEVNDKIYVNDHGIRNSILRREAGDIGDLLENIVYIELRRRGYTVTVGRFNDWEIDFVAVKGRRTEYFQVCYLLSSEETAEREYRPLEALPDNYRKHVLSMDRIHLGRNGIEHYYIPNWLLKEH